MEYADEDLYTQVRSEVRDLSQYETWSIFSYADKLARDVKNMYIDPEDTVERGPNYFKAHRREGDHTEECSTRELGAAFSALAKMDSTSLKMESLSKSNRYDAKDINGENLYGVLESISAIAEEGIPGYESFSSTSS